MRNILVGIDGSRGAQTALRQALGLCSGPRARLHLVRAVEPGGPDTDLGVDEPGDPLAILDRAEALSGETEEAPAAEDDDMAAALRMCEDAGVSCTHQRLHGPAWSVLRDQAPAMDALVIGRHGHAPGRPLGANAAAIIARPVVPTVLCREEVVPWERLLLAFERSAAGGRALKLAGDLAAELNVSLDVLVAAPERERGARNLASAQKALRAYHVDGEFVHHRGRTPEVLQSAALELNSAVVAVPAGPGRRWPRARAATVTAALNLPGALVIIVP